MPANEEIDSISLGLRGDASSLLTALTKGGNAVIKFTKTVTDEAEKATSTLDAMFAGSARAVSMLQTPLAELSPELSTLSNVVKRLAETFREADTEIAGAGSTTRKTKEEFENSAAAVNRLAREYKAGALSVAEYTTKLRAMAETSEAGSEKQLAAMARLKAFREGATEAARRESERSAAQQLKDIANVEKGEKQALADRIKGIKEVEAAQAKADRERAQAQRKQNHGEASIAHGLGAAGNAMTLGVTAPVMFAGVDALKAASALNEQESKTQVVFKESAAEIVKWSETSADAFGMSQRAALDEASSVGNFLQELGTGPEKTAEMSKTLTTLAGNFASLYDKNPEEIMTKFRAGLSGVSKPLKQYGIDVSIAALKQEAYADGIAKPTVNLDKLKSAQFRVGEAQMKLNVATEKYGAGSYEAMKAQDALNRAQSTLNKTQAGSTGQLTTLQKAQAAYAIILKHSATAQADYKNTFDQEANTRRRLAAEVEDCAAAYGKALLPALIKLEHQLEAVVKWFKALSPEQKENVIHLIELAAAIGPVLKLLELLVNGFIAFQKAQAFLKDLPQLLTNVAAKITAMQTAEAGAAAEMTVLSGATAVAEAALASMGVAGVTGVTAIIVAVGLLAVALAGIAADIYLIKRDWDVVAETIAMNKKTEADNAASDATEIGQNTKLKEQYRMGTEYRKFLKAGKGNRDDFIRSQDMSDEQRAYFDEGIPAAPRGGRGFSAASPQQELDKLGGSLDIIDNNLMASQSRMDAATRTRKLANAAAKPAPKLPPLPKPTTPHVPQPSKHGKTGNAIGQRDIAPPNLADLQPLQDLYGTMPLADQPTNASNYEAKKAELEAAAARRKLKTVEQSGPLSPDQEYNDDKQKFGHALNLSSNAITQTQSEIDKLLPQTIAAEDKVRSAYAAANAELHRQIALKQSGHKITQQEANSYAALNHAYEASKKVYHDDKTALDANKRANEAATRDKTESILGLAALEKKRNEETRKTELGAIKRKFETDADETGAAYSRDQMDAELAAAIGRVGKGSEAAKPFEDALAESAVARANAVKDLHLKTLSMDGKDFQARREGVTEEAENYRKGGASETDVQAFIAKSNKKIGQDEWEQGFHEQEAKFRDDMEDGTQTLADYKQFLTGAIAQATEQFGQGSVKVAALNRELDHTKWQIAEEQATEFKRAVDEGGDSLTAYIAKMKELQASVSPVSAEYRRLGEQIDAAGRKMRNDAHQTADRIGTEYGGMFVKLLRRTASFGQMLRETLNRAMDDALAGMMKRAISSVIFRMLDRSNKAKQSAEDKQVQAGTVQKGAASDQIVAANAQVTAANLQKTASENNLQAAQLNQQAASQTETASADGENVGMAEGASGAGGVPNWTSAALSNVGKMTDGKYSLGDAAGTGMDVAKAGAFGAKFASAMPWLGAGLAAATLLGGFLSKPKKPDYVSHDGAKQFSSVGQGDHTGLIDSGYSGVDGIRMLQSGRTARQSVVGASNGAQHTHNYAAGAFQINTQPHHDENKVVQMVGDMLDQRERFANSLTGNT